MTYNVFGGTLNLAQSNQCSIQPKQQTSLFLNTAQESRGSHTSTPAFLCCSDPPCLRVLRPSLALCHHLHAGSELKSPYKNVPSILYTRTPVDCLTLMSSLQLN